MPEKVKGPDLIAGFHLTAQAFAALAIRSVNGCQSSMMTLDDDLAISVIKDRSFTETVITIHQDSVEGELLQERLAKRPSGAVDMVDELGRYIPVHDRDPQELMALVEIMARAKTTLSQLLNPQSNPK